MESYRLRRILWCLTGLLATLVLLGFPWLQYGAPLSLAGDHVFSLKVMREMQEGVVRFNHKLGAPWSNDNLYFPLFDFSYKALSWLIGRFITDIFSAIALLYLLGVSLM